MQEVISSPVALSDSAAEELKRIRVGDTIPSEKYLRIGVKGGGCSGLTYILDFDDKQEFDDLYVVNGVELIVDQRQALYLHGIEIDYQNGLNDRGFIFNNPNASSTCGCGTSFATWGM